MFGYCRSPEDTHSSLILAREQQESQWTLESKSVFLPTQEDLLQDHQQTDQVRASYITGWAEGCYHSELADLLNLHLEEVATDWMDCHQREAGDCWSEKDSL